MTDSDRRRLAAWLLADERGAWRALTMLRRCDRRLGRSAPAAGAASTWEESLEDVVAELHALSAKVQALRAGAPAP